MSALLRQVVRRRRGLDFACKLLTRWQPSRTLGRMSTAQMAAVPDEVLAVRAAERSSADGLAAARQACAELYQLHARALLAFLASRLPRADLEDVHHAVWVRVWEHLPGGFHGGHFRGWLFEIARNLAIDHCRRRRAEPLANEGDLRDPRRGAQPEEALLEEERRQVLAECMKKLEARAASLVQARLAGESYEELAPRLGLGAAAAYKVWHMAVKQLQTCVGRILS